MFDKQLDGDQRGECEAEIARLREDYSGACKLVVQMHFAATGSLEGVQLGVVEDLTAMRQDADRWRWFRLHGWWPDTEATMNGASPEEFDRMADAHMTPNV